MSITRASSSTVAMHEAFHAASLCFAGMTPLVARIDGHNGLAGSVRIDWDGHGVGDHTIREALLATILAPMSEGMLRDDWPICPEDWDDAVQQDAEQAAFLVDCLGFGGLDWMRVIFDARQRTRSRRFRLLVRAISTELERLEVLLQPELIELTRSIEVNA